MWRGRADLCRLGSQYPKRMIRGPCVQPAFGRLIARRAEETAGLEIDWLNWTMQLCQGHEVVGSQSTSPSTPVLPFGFLPDLTPVKFGSACPPFPYGSRLQPIGPINLPLAGRSNGPLAPDFWVRVGGLEAIGPNTTPNACHTLLFLAKFDTRQIRQHLPAPWAGATGRTRPGRRCRIYDRRYRPNRPCPSLTLSGNRTDQSATGRLLRRSSGTRPSWAVATRGEQPHPSQRPPLAPGLRGQCGRPEAASPKADGATVGQPGRI